MRAMLITMTVAIMATGQTRSKDEVILYDRALILIEAGEFDRARLFLQTLINTNPQTALREKVRLAIRTSWVRQGISDPDPMLLFVKGQTRLSAGKREAALMAFATLINVYPASEYSQKARQVIRTLQPQVSFCTHLTSAKDAQSLYALAAFFNVYAGVSARSEG